jgi:adenine-specific DNA methylase
MPDDFDPDKGTVSRAVAVCPVCGSAVEAKTTRRLFQEGKAGERMGAVILTKPGETGKRYRVATKEDMEAFNKAAENMEEKRKKLHGLWGIDPVPDEEMPPRGTLGFRVQPYGMTTWGSLFNARQKLSLINIHGKG